MLIESQEDMELSGEANDGEQAIALASERRPDVMLMDLRMPVMDGVEATQRIVQRAGCGRHRQAKNYRIDHL